MFLIALLLTNRPLLKLDSNDSSVGPAAASRICIRVFKGNCIPKTTLYHTNTKLSPSSLILKTDFRFELLLNAGIQTFRRSTKQGFEIRYRLWDWQDPSTNMKMHLRFD